MPSLFELALDDLPRLYSKSNHAKDTRELQELFALLKIEQDIETNAVIERFPAIWSDFLDLDAGATNLKFKDRPAQMCLLSALYQIDQARSHDIEVEFKKRGGWYERSVAELKLRLSGRLYKYARRIWRDFKNATDTGACLDYSLEVSDLRPNELASLKDATLKVLYGFRGASREILGRTRETDFNFWQLAYQDMSRSYELGNRSAEAKEFLRGIAVSRFVKHDTLEHYDDALRLFGSDSEDEPQAIGELVTVAAAAAPRLAEQSHESAFNAAMEGERLARKALHMPDVGSEPTHIPFLKQQRAFLSMVMIQNGSEIPDQELERLLDENIADFEIGLSVGIGGANLPDALMRRASLRVRQGKLPEARADLHKCREVLPNLQSMELKERIDNTASSINARISFDECFQSGDYSGAIRTAANSNQFLPHSYYNFIEYLSKLRQLIDSPLFTPSIDDADVLRKFLQSISKAPEEIEPASSAEFILSHAANLSRTLDGPRVTRQTLDLYRLANKLATANKLEISSFAGNVFLQAGKQEAEAGEADTSSLLEESISLFEECLKVYEKGETEHSDAFVPRVVYSKAGEAHLRLAKYLLPEVSSYERAFVLFDKSVALGNSAPEVLGLMGDAKYRVAIGGSSETEFEAALDLKARARESGSHSRENYSVSARISERLFQLRGDPRLLSDALAFAINAIEADRNWAWPYIQIWESMRRNKSVWSSIVDGANLHCNLDPEFLAKVQIGDADYVIREGVQKTILSGEFRRKELGGRSEVFLVDDPHGLLGSTVVLKPTTSNDADRETAEALAVNELIEAAGKKDTFSVIEPMCTVDDGSRHVMAMRYAEGGTLAQRILRATALGNFVPAGELSNVAEFLALFHRPTLDTENGFGLRGLSRFLKALRDAVGREQLERVLGCIGSAKLPAVRKKDAHAENWIVDGSGRVTMLDLESQRKQPLFADLSQLFDDFPACAPTDAGWRGRELLAEGYMGKLDLVLGEELSLRPYLELFAIWRAAVMLPSITRKQQNERSLSSLKAYQSRREHLVSNMAFLSRAASFPEMAAMAQLVGIRFGARSAQ